MRIGSMTTVLQSSSVPRVKILYVLALITALTSFLFCGIFLGLLLHNFFLPQPPAATGEPTFVNAQGVPVFSSDPSYRQPATDSFNSLPTDNPDFLQLKRKLAENRTDEKLISATREKDQSLRQTYFSRREFIEQTDHWLLVAAVTFLISTTAIAVLRRKLPFPRAEGISETRRQEQLRLQKNLLAWLVFSGLLVGLALGGIAMTDNSLERMLVAKTQPIKPHPPLPSDVDRVVANDAADTSALTTPEPPLNRNAFVGQLAANWPSFRGFDCTGSGATSAEKTLMPTQWNAVTGENILWQTEIPLPGKSSPIIWGNRLFVTGAESKAGKPERKVYCLNTDDGTILWATDIPVTDKGQGELEVNDDTGLAAPTMVTDGRRAVALFANGDLVALDFDGKILWSYGFGIPDSQYGFASSPALYFDRVIVQYDVGDGSDGQSKLVAFDIKTGSILWETPREIPNSWSSPMVRKFGESYQIITCGNPFVISYDPETGKELWRCKCLTGDVGPSPTAVGDVVIVTNQGPRTTAIDATAAAMTGGDVTEKYVLWQGVGALPDTPSPFASDNRVFTLDYGGYLTGYNPSVIDERKRAAAWELELGEGMASFYSSPIRAGDFVYVFSMTEDDPKGFVIDLSQEKVDGKNALEQEAANAMRVAANPMSEPCVTTPAIVGTRIIIRGSTTIFCIGK